MISLSKCLKTIEKTGKSIDEAVELALAELGVDRDSVDVEVIDEGSKGFLGIGAKEATVVVTVKNDDEKTAKEFLSKIFAAMNLEVDIDIADSDDSMNIDLSGDHMGIIIGKRGDTLDSLQYLTSLVVNSNSDKYKKVTIDTENYREKRSEALVALANRLAKKVEKSGKRYTLEPMNPYERRIIHSTLQDNEMVTTYSIGEDPYRKVVIALADGVKPPKKVQKNEKPRRKNHEEVKKDKVLQAASVSESVFIDYANYAKERAMRPKVQKAKAGSFDEYLANLEKDNAEETTEE